LFSVLEYNPNIETITFERIELLKKFAPGYLRGHNFD